MAKCEGEHRLAEDYFDKINKNVLTVYHRMLMGMSPPVLRSLMKTKSRWNALFR
jgi:hypothetical protein